MRLSLYTVLVIQTALVIPTLYGCGTEGPEPEGRLFEYDENQLNCFYELNDDTASTLCLRSGAFKMDVPTWSSLDLAYELTGDTTILSSEWMTDLWDATHLGFFTQKTGDASLEILFDYLETDYLTDNTPMTPTPFDELYGRYPTARETVSVPVDAKWQQFDVYAAAPGWADAIGIHIVKSGTGSVLLSRLVLNSDGEDPSPSGYENLNDPCESDDECGTAFCAPMPKVSTDGSEVSICSMCSLDEHCDEATVCGVEDSGLSRGCVVSGVRSLGDFCAVTAECKEGVCCAGRCSSCCDDEPCEDSIECAQLEGGEPYQCDPASGTYAMGDACYRNEDCESGCCESEDIAGDEYWPEPCYEIEPVADSLSIGVRYGRCMDPSEVP